MRLGPIHYNKTCSLLMSGILVGYLKQEVVGHSFKVKTRLTSSYSLVSHVSYYIPRGNATDFLILLLTTRTNIGVFWTYSFLFEQSLQLSSRKEIEDTKEVR